MPDWFLRDFKCQCGHKFEALLERCEKDEEQPCPKCGLLCKHVPWNDPGHAKHISWATWRTEVSG